MRRLAETKWGPALRPAPTAPSVLSWSPLASRRTSASVAQASHRCSGSSEDVRGTVQRPFLGRSAASNLSLSASIVMRLHRHFRRLSPMGCAISPEGAERCFRIDRDHPFFSCPSPPGRFGAGSLFRSQGRRSHEARVAPSGICAQAPVDNGDIGERSATPVKGPEQRHEQAGDRESAKQSDHWLAPQAERDRAGQRQQREQDAGRTGRTPGCHKRRMPGLRRYGQDAVDPLFARGCKDRKLEERP